MAYGFDDAKCKHECYTKSEADTLINAKADKAHASTSKDYGIGSATEYGHVKTTTSTVMPAGNMDGVALAGTMGYSLSLAIAQASTKAEIPIHGIFSTDGTFSGGQAIHDLLGYGTWSQYYYVSDSQGTQVWFWLRTA